MGEITRKVEKVLSQNLWYHGTVFSNWDSFCKNGILVDYNKDTSDALDFGYGFYLTHNREKAEHFITSMMKNSNFYSDNEKPMILGFELNPIDWFNGVEYQTKVFDKFDDKFAEFVFENRIKNIAGKRQHNYDVIYGVMSDAVPTLLMQEYKMGNKTKEQVIESLKKSTSMKQMSLHNQKLCDTIDLREAYIFDMNTNQRKELDIDEYGKQRIH